MQKIVGSESRKMIRAMLQPIIAIFMQHVDIVAEVTEHKQPKRVSVVHTGQDECLGLQLSQLQAVKHSEEI